MFTISDVKNHALIRERGKLLEFYLLAEGPSSNFSTALRTQNWWFDNNAYSRQKVVLTISFSEKVNTACPDKGYFYSPFGFVLGKRWLR